MNCTVIIDWRFAVALGVACGIVILASKMDDAEAAVALVHAIDAASELDSVPCDEN